MSLKMNKIYCGEGFPNLPDFKDLSGGGSGSAAVMAGQAIRISDISVSNVSYKRINANVDDLTIAVDGVTNKLKSLVKGLYNYSTSEVNTGQKWIDGKDIFCKVLPITAMPNNGELVINHGLTNFTLIDIFGTVKDSTGAQIVLPYSSPQILTYTPAELNISVAVNATSIVITTGIDRSAFSGNIVMYYVKED